MAPVTYGTWSAYYERNREDNGAIQRLFRTNMTSFRVMTENHLDNAVRLTETIAGSNFGNMFLVPGLNGRMQVLHHGFTHAGELGGSADILAVNGNLSEAAIKVIPKETAVQVLGNNTGRRSGTECPTLESILAVNTAGEFTALAPNGNVILKLKPNHLFIGPEIFELAKGAKQIRSSDLAMLIIEKFKADDDDDDQVNTARLDEAGENELLLAFLWASAKDLLVPITLGEPDESAVLNNLHKRLKENLIENNDLASQRGGSSGGQGRGFMDDDEEVEDAHTDTQTMDGDESTASSIRRPGVRETPDRFRELTLTTAGIVEVMKSVEMARQAERRSDAQDRSLLKHLGRKQRGLFLALSTPDLGVEPELSEFMELLVQEKSATRALQLIISESKDWEGTFSAGGFHRFLSTGFIAQEKNRANPGGFNLFIFHPRTIDVGGSAFDAGRARLRDLFDADVDEETINHYSKQGLYAASNHHDLKIQLQTALDMLELLLGPGSIATAGLTYVLETSRWRRMSILFHERFKNESHFGPKILYCLDRNLQQFFQQMENRDQREGELSPTFLRDKAMDLLNLIDGGYDVTVRLPTALQPPPPTPAAQANSGLAEPPLAITDGGGPPKKKGKKTNGAPGPVGEPGSAIVQNPAPHQAWQLPEGTRYAEYFQGRAQSTKNWPVVPDDRLGSRSPAPLCIRFQATSACRRNCRLAHVSRASLETGARRIADEKFVAAYAATPTASTALVVT